LGDTTLEFCSKKLVLATFVGLAMTGCFEDEIKLIGPAGSQPSSSSSSSSGNGNAKPSANAGIDQTVDELNTITLDGSESTDSDGSIASYRWVQIANSAPTITLSNDDTAQATFLAPNISVDTKFEFRLFVIDDDGSSGADNVIINLTAIPVAVTNLPPMFDGVPEINKTATLNLNALDPIGEASWSIVSQPGGSDINLSASSDQKTLTFTPTVAGDYQLLVESTTTSSSKTIDFKVSPTTLAFDIGQIDAFTGSSTTQLGTVKNQAWISSASLNEAEITALVTAMTGFTVIGFDDDAGLLIEFDATDTTIPESLALLEMTAGIDSVEPRVYEGLGVGKDEAITPDDGSGFTDLGDNWHLEQLQLTDAWELTTGSSTVLVGVSDGGFDTLHDELDGRVMLQYTSDESAHGTAIAATIGGNTDNGVGISAINWVSPLVLADNQLSSVSALLNIDELKVVNGGWAIPGYIDDSFSIFSANSVIAHYEQALTLTRPYRQLAKTHPEQLLVWSAGNGVNNGSSNSTGVYGVDGRLHSPALHYDDNGFLNPMDNVVFVGAMTSDGRLKHYSNYGKAVDIVAPSGYKAAALDGEYFTADSYGSNEASGTGFDGTSSAAATVSGVASLIYSLYPSFTGQEVKEILINSASETVTERYLGPGDAGTANANIASLSRAIPALDAAAALTMAKSIIDNKVAVAAYTIPNPLTAQANIQFKSLDADRSVTAVNWSLQSSANGVDGWASVTAANVNGDLAEPVLDTSKPYHRLTATITLTHTGDSSTSQTNKTYDFSYSTIKATLKDTVTLAALSGVTVTPESLDGLTFTTTATSDINGEITLYAKRGAYKLLSTLTDYQDGAISFTANGEDNQNFEFYMADSTLVPDQGVGGVSSLSGYVFDLEGEPVADAVVRISGGASTNGFFASVITGSDGRFGFSNVSRKDASGSAIQSFAVQATAEGFFSSTKEGFVLLSGKDHTEVIPLVDQSQFGETLFADDFESGENGWLANGFWHQETLNGSLVNTLVDSGHTSLAPDEAGPQAPLPFAASGDVAWWYGLADTGTFVGTQSAGDSLLSGGRSESANEGQLFSPSIDLANAISPVLLFNTWWEVESVNPNSAGFDILEILISTDGGSTYDSIKRLNPFVDPNDSDRNHKPFSSGGFFRKPVWVIEEMDLSDYVGKNIKVQFKFDTRDALYNGFRGWVIDDFRVIDVTSTSSASTKSVSPVLTKSRSYTSQLDETPPADYFDGLSESFLDVHKRPQELEELPPPSR